MYNFKLNDKSFDLAESWFEVKLKTYIKIAKLEESRSDFKYGELYLLKLIEILSEAEEGDLDDLSIDEINEISNRISFVNTVPEFSRDKYFKIGDVIYASPDDFKTLSIGEFISVKTYQEQFTSVWDAAPWLLAILWRPATEIYDEERGATIIKREGFKADNLEFRKNLFMDQPAINLINAMLFFSNMSSGFISNTEDSILKGQSVQMEDDPVRSV